MYGTQAVSEYTINSAPFENDVKMYGTQALEKAVGRAYWFENDVKMYGTQAYTFLFLSVLSLRMM